MNGISSKVNSYVASLSRSNSYKMNTQTLDGLSSSPIDVDVQSNPMCALPSKRKHEDDNPTDPITSHYNRMVTRSTLEEGCIDVDVPCVDVGDGKFHSAKNDFARRRTANMLDQAPRVMNFIDTQMQARSQAEFSSPQLIRKYDYYFRQDYEE